MSAPPSPGVGPETGPAVLATYRFLRLGILVLTLVLATGVVQQVIRDGGALLPSISAYYYSPARAVVVGCLCAIGALMIVHRGRSALEDVALDAAGFLAFLVAFVPTARPQDVAVVLAGASRATGVSPGTVLDNTWAVLVGGLAALVLTAVVVPRAERCTASRAGRAGLVACATGFVGLVTWVLIAPDVFLRFGHTVAAVGLFGGIVAVVGINAVARARATAGKVGHPWRNRYGVGFVLLLASAVLGVAVLRPLDDAWVFWLEAAVIVQFAAFWVAQTVERWHSEDERVPRWCYPG